MSKSSPWLYFIVLSLSVLAGLCLDSMVLPGDINAFRPEFTLVILCCWILLFPSRTNIATAFVLGIMIDILQNSLLGSHALSFSIVAFLLLKLRQRVYLKPPWQQAPFIVPVLLANQLIISWLYSMQYHTTTDWYFMLPAFSSAVCFVPFAYILRLNRHRLGFV